MNWLAPVLAEADNWPKAFESVFFMLCATIIALAFIMKNFRD